MKAETTDKAEKPAQASKASKASKAKKTAKPEKKAAKPTRKASDKAAATDKADKDKDKDKVDKKAAASDRDRDRDKAETKAGQSRAASKKSAATDSTAGKKAKATSGKEPGKTEAAPEKPGRRKKTRAARAAAPAAVEGASPAVPEAKPEAAVETAAAEVALLDEQQSRDAADVLSPKERAVRMAEPSMPSDEALEELYGDEVAGEAASTAFGEYRDERTADEDRPMTPEIVASRRDRQKRERRRKRRDRRDEEVRPAGKRAEREQRAERPEREQRAERPERERPERERPERERPERERPAQPAAGEVAARLDSRAASGLPFYRVGNMMGDGAVEILASVRDGQPLQIKQVAQMMRKRQLVDGRPEDIWPHLKVALLADEASHRSYGLRSRISYRGRDLFARARVPGGELVARENALAAASDDLARATHAAIKERLFRLDRAALERLVHVCLVRQGWHSISWIKQVQKTSYAVGEAPDGLGQVLVGVRAGREPVDRRGIGELRVGVQAKGLASGLLVTPASLSDVARQELSRPGPAIAILCGDRLVAELAQGGMGATLGHVPALCFDSSFFDDLENP